MPAVLILVLPLWTCRLPARVFHQQWPCPTSVRCSSAEPHLKSLQRPSVLPNVSHEIPYDFPVLPLHDLITKFLDHSHIHGVAGDTLTAARQSMAVQHHQDAVQLSGGVVSPRQTG
ncbi:hypothetical protein ALP73_00780 [Pseudomonas coronafaciens pv. garcae]|nr:hypothetical protein ALP73_00780 [Pseudomonas coronafaciens pv. garcae]